MDIAQQTNEEQTALWNGPAGHAWVDAQDILDRVFKPLEDVLVGVADAGARVLDVGCGTGSTTLAIARHLEPNGHCTGIDVSEPMLAAARARAEREGVAARFIRADAQNHVFAPASVDMIVSRFGVMFFDDSVRAFTNLRRAATRGGKLQCIVWRSAAENPFMTTAERAAAPLLPSMPARKPDAPGQFALADERRASAMLEQSGWTSIDIRPIDVECTFAEKDLVRYFSHLGPVGFFLRDADDKTRSDVIATVRAAFEPYVQQGIVRFSIACWMLGASA